MLARLWAGARTALRTAIARLSALVERLAAMLRPPLVAALQVAAALVLIFEEWGWKPLSQALAWLARFRLVAKLEAVIARLPPYAALLVFALPTAILFPLKLLAVWLVANEQVLAATLLFLGAKVASTALVARLLVLTRPALMQIGWFARAYTLFVPWKDRMFAAIRATWVWRTGRVVKAGVRRALRQAVDRWKPAVVRWAGEARAVLRAVRARLRLAARAFWNGLAAGRD